MSSSRLIKLEINSEQIRPLILEILKTKSDEEVAVSQLHSELIKLVQDRGLPVNDPGQNISIYVDYPKTDKRKIQDVLWDLTIEGLIRPGSDGNLTGTANGYSFSSFHLTEIGQQSLQNEPKGVYDPNGYLESIKEIEALDPVISIYLEESLTTFRMGCLLSSSVTLGCASEKALLLLIDAYTNSISDQRKREDFAKKVCKSRTIQKKFEEFEKKLKGEILAHPDLQQDIKENIENELSGIFQIIRRYRNDAGHPTGTEIKRNTVFSNLYVFPQYLRKVYELINWLKNQNL